MTAYCADSRGEPCGAICPVRDASVAAPPGHYPTFSWLPRWPFACGGRCHPWTERHVPDEPPAHADKEKAARVCHPNSLIFLTCPTAGFEPDEHVASQCLYSPCPRPAATCRWQLATPYAIRAAQAFATEQPLTSRPSSRQCPSPTRTASEVSLQTCILSCV
jgi:hypothetical protein